MRPLRSYEHPDRRSAPWWQEMASEWFATRFPALDGVPLRDLIRPVAITTVAVALVAAGCWWMWFRPVPATEPISLPLAAPAAPTEVEVVVHVSGAVTNPGVYRLAAGARVTDALAMAGGPLVGAQVDVLNLAAPLRDGEQVYVPAEGEDPPALPSAGATASDGTVDINRATAAELESLPGIGPATAAAIIEHRERNGPFTSVDELIEVPGIGPAKLAQLRDRARV
ncbi:MAG TPA: helix-hairpin-helix domain-containing protein [Acidimicrobiales bacterium]